MSDKPGSYSYDGLDRVLHEKARLGILTSLFSNPDGLVFGEIKSLCSLTDGNLSRHLQVLEREQLVEIIKETGSGRPKTTVKITDLGRDRFQTYLGEFDEALEDLSLTGVSLLRGEKTDKIKVEDITRKETGDLQLGIITDQGFTGAIAGLTGTETFTVTANSVDVTMDFSEISGTLSVENIVNYMNGKLEAAEVLSAVKFEYY